MPVSRNRDLERPLDSLAGGKWQLRKELRRAAGGDSGEKCIKKGCIKPGASAAYNPAARFCLGRAVKGKVPSNRGRESLARATIHPGNLSSPKTPDPLR